MPANLPAEARAKWAKVMDARTPEEKLRALEEFLSAVPKHKGTEKLRMMARRQMAQLRRQIEEARRRRRGGGRGFFVKKEGDVQVALLGFANSGKSTFLQAFTNARVEATDVPYETREPVPGMLTVGGVDIQLVEVPSIMEGASKGVAWGPQALALARNADYLLLVADASMGPEHQLRLILSELNAANIKFGTPETHVEVVRRSLGGIIVVGELKDATLKDVEALLKSYGIHHALIKVWGEAGLDDVEEALFRTVTYKPGAVLLTKVDMVEDVGEILRKVEPIIGGKEVFLFSKTNPSLFNSKKLLNSILSELKLIRIYTRKERVVENKPLVVEKGSTVGDVAKIIHSRLYKHFRYAKVWSTRLRFSPQKVGLDFVLEDGDVVEIVGG